MLTVVVFWRRRLLSSSSGVVVFWRRGLVGSGKSSWVWETWAFPGCEFRQEQGLATCSSASGVVVLLGLGSLVGYGKYGPNMGLPWL
jgi:hypothetical protein